jgi:uncharacterized repeat protein (TIGR03803 family)
VYLAATLAFLPVPPAVAQTETILYNFCSKPNCRDGEFPNSTLVSDGKGNFYGTTLQGGLGSSGGYGTVFQLSPDGSGGWNETVLHRFTGGADGAYPNDVVFDNVEEKLYGTTTFGGAANSFNGYGGGV